MAIEREKQRDRRGRERTGEEEVGIRARTMKGRRELVMRSQRREKRAIFILFFFFLVGRRAAASVDMPPRYIGAATGRRTALTNAVTLR